MTQAPKLVPIGRVRLQTAGSTEDQHLIPVTNGNPVGSVRGEHGSYNY